jgi:hypothetical protein
LRGVATGSASTAALGVGLDSYAVTAAAERPPPWWGEPTPAAATVARPPPLPGGLPLATLSGKHMGNHLDGNSGSTMPSSGPPSSSAGSVPPLPLAARGSDASFTGRRSSPLADALLPAGSVTPPPGGAPGSGSDAGFSGKGLSPLANGYGLAGFGAGAPPGVEPRLGIAPPFGAGPGNGPLPSAEALLGAGPPTGAGSGTGPLFGAKPPLFGAGPPLRVGPQHGHSRSSSSERVLSAFGGPGQPAPPAAVQPVSPPPVPRVNGGGLALPLSLFGRPVPQASGPGTEAPIQCMGPEQAYCPCTNQLKCQLRAFRRPASCLRGDGGSPDMTALQGCRLGTCSCCPSGCAHVGVWTSCAFMTAAKLCSQRALCCHTASGKANGLSHGGVDASDPGRRRSGLWDPLPPTPLAAPASALHLTLSSGDLAGWVPARRRAAAAWCPVQAHATAESADAAAHAVDCLSRLN